MSNGILRAFHKGMGGFFNRIAVVLILMSSGVPMARAEDAVKLNEASDAYFRSSLSSVLKEMKQKGRASNVEAWGEQRTAFTTESNPELQRKVDLAFELLLSTPTGKSWLRQSTASRAFPGADHEAHPLSRELLQSINDWSSITSEMIFNWGISAVAADLIAYGENRHPCGDQTNWSGSGVAVADSSGKTYFYGKKNYWFILGPNPWHIDSYTLEDNQSFVMIDDLENQDLALLNVLIHEMSVAGDRKTRLAEWLRRANGGQLPSEWRQATMNPAFLQLMAVMRAYRLEAKIMSDLHATDPDRFPLSPTLKRFVDPTPSDCNDLYQDLVGGRFLDTLKLPRADRDHLRNYLSVETSVPYGRQGSRNACLLFSEPSAEFHSYSSSGPRPREGGW